MVDERVGSGDQLTADAAGGPYVHRRAWELGAKARVKLPLRICTHLGIWIGKRAWVDGCAYSLA